MDSEPSNDRLEEVLEELRERTDAILEEITEDPEETPGRERQVPPDAPAEDC